MLDNYFFGIFQYYKPKYKAKANNIALVYILILQTSLFLALGAFLMLFLKQMHVDVISTSKAWALFVIGIVILIFRNWIYYTGKHRKILNTKLNKGFKRPIWLIWSIPVGCFVFAILLLQRY